MVASLARVVSAENFLLCSVFVMRVMCSNKMMQVYATFQSTWTYKQRTTHLLTISFLLSTVGWSHLVQDKQDEDCPFCKFFRQQQWPRTSTVCSETTLQ